MKLLAMDIFALSAPYQRDGAAPDHPSTGVRNCVFVRLTDSLGRAGWGEAYPGCYATEVTIAALHRFRRSIIVDDDPPPAELLARMRFANRYWAMRGIGAAATSAIEAAVLDLHAQSAGVPLWKLLGGGGTRVLAYASAGDNSFSPDEIAAQCRRIRAMGFRAYKMRVGGLRTDCPDQRLPVDIARVAAAREALGPDAALYVDAGVPQRPVAWTLDQAERYFRALAAYNVGFFEEPAMTYDVDAYAHLQRLDLIPTAGGESFADSAEFEPFFESRALGVAQPDAAVVGGPASALAVCRSAARRGVPVCLHAWSAGVGIAQNLHAAWAATNVIAIEWPISRHAPQTEPLSPIVQFQDGYLLPSPRPGLGVNVTDELLHAHRYRPGTDRDF